MRAVLLCRPAADFAKFPAKVVDEGPQRGIPPAGAVQVHAVDQFRGELDAAQGGGLIPIADGVGQELLVVAALALFATDLRPVADHAVERVGIGQEPALDMRVGAACDEPVQETRPCGLPDLGPLLRRGRAVAVDDDDEEIGRINARLLANGRIEFAFTPTDGERILPSSRFFPTGATIDRWLRSTPIEVEVGD